MGKSGDKKKKARRKEKAQNIKNNRKKTFPVIRQNKRSELEGGKTKPKRIRAPAAGAEREKKTKRTRQGRPGKRRLGKEEEIRLWEKGS